MKDFMEWKPVKQAMNWKISKLIRWFLAYIKPMNISNHGAYTSFFLIMSVFPLLVILFGVLGFTSVGLEDVVDLVSQFVPQTFMSMVEKVLLSAYANTSVSVLSISILTALWSAGHGIYGLIVGLNAVYGLKEDRNYFVTRGLSMVYTLLFVIVLVLTLVLHVFGNTLVDYLRMTTDPVVQFIMDILDLRFFLLLFLQTALFTAMYSALPNRHNSLKESLPGALLSAIGWLTFTDGFSIYVDYFPKYDNVFGSVYAMALAMLWLYFCISIIFYGGVLNRFLMEKQDLREIWNS